MMNRKLFISTLVATLIMLAGVGTYAVFESIEHHNKQTEFAVPYIHNEGEAQGTTYSITYQQPDGIDLQSKIEERLNAFDMSLSTYRPNSIISRINRNDKDVRTDTDFETMYRVARQVSENTNGAFDITVGPLVKAWGFAFGNKGTKKIPDVNKLLTHVGYKKIELKDHRLIKSEPGIVVDANALAQGQSVDVISRLLEANGCKNYLVEIGGEVFCKGVNAKNEYWTVGIDVPVEDSVSADNGLQSIVRISGMAINTSGNYRKFYYLNGKKYAHEINPHTGYPVEHDLLSATVVASSCIVADAYATAFMVMGKEAALAFCKAHKELDCYLIYSDNKGHYQVAYSEGFQKYLTR